MCYPERVNYWKLMLSISFGILIAVALIFGACKIGYDQDAKASRMRMWEQIASQYQERTGRTVTPEEMERGFQEDQTKKARR